MTRNKALSGDAGSLAASATDLPRYLGVFLRRWWLILAAVTLTVGSVWWSQRDDLPVYTAQVLLQQRREAPVVGGGTLGGVGVPDFGSQIEVLRSGAVLSDVVRSLGLQLVLADQQNRRTELFLDLQIDADVPPRGYALHPEGGRIFLLNTFTGERLAEVLPGEMVEGPGFRFRLGEAARGLQEPVRFSLLDPEVALGNLRRTVRIEQGSGRDFIRVQYRSPDAALAAEVANHVALSYQAYQAQTARQAAAYRRDVIAGEIELLADSLRRAQEQVESYQASSQLLNPDVEGNALMSALLETENELRRLRFDQGLLEGLVVGLRSGDPDDDSLRRVMALGRELVPSGTELDQRLQTLQAERRALTGGTFGATDSAPEVQILDQQIASTQEQMRIVAEQSLQLLGSRIGAAEARIGDLRQQMGGLPIRASELNRLQQRVDAVQGVFDQLVERYYEAQIATSVEAGDVALVDPASVPLWPDPSGHTLNLLMAILGGLVLGGVGALALEQFDSRVRRPWDAEQVGGVQVLGAVPHMGSGSERASKARTIGIEAFRGIRTNLRFVPGRRPRTLAICSAAPAEGKTMVAVNLALALAEEGEKVILVDADLRRPRLHEMLGTDGRPGLAEYLTDRVSLAEAIRSTQIHPSIHVIPSGHATTAHASLVGSKKFKELLRSLAGEYDTVLVDTPPVLAVSDASLIASSVDGNIIVVRANSTDREALTNTMEQLRRVNAPTTGIVLNDVGVKSVGYSEYYGSYHTDGYAGRLRRKRRKKLLVGAGSPSSSEQETVGAGSER